MHPVCIMMAYDLNEYFSVKGLKIDIIHVHSVESVCVCISKCLRAFTA